MKVHRSEQFPIPAELIPVLDAVSLHGTPLVAGGAVRDWLLGATSKDLYIEVFARGT